MMPRKLPLASVARVLPLAMYSSYSLRCRLDSLQDRRDLCAEVSLTTHRGASHCGHRLLTQS